MSRRPAAVIVGADLNGLGVVRNLARLNMPIFVVGKSRFESAILLRFAHPVVSRLNTDGIERGSRRRRRAVQY
jgi:hypothetical protein